MHGWLKNVFENLLVFEISFWWVEKNLHGEVTHAGQVCERSVEIDFQIENYHLGGIWWMSYGWGYRKDRLTSEGVICKRTRLLVVWEHKGT